EQWKDPAAKPTSAGRPAATFLTLHSPHSLSEIRGSLGCATPYLHQSRNHGEVRRNMKTSTRLLAVRMGCNLAVLGVVMLSAASGRAYAQVVSHDSTVALDSGNALPGGVAGVNSGTPKTNSAGATNAEVLKELEAMRARIQDLEAKLKAQQ